MGDLLDYLPASWRKWVARHQVIRATLIALACGAAVMAFPALLAFSGGTTSYPLDGWIRYAVLAALCGFALGMGMRRQEEDD